MAALFLCLIEVLTQNAPFVDTFVNRRGRMRQHDQGRPDLSEK